MRFDPPTSGARPVWPPATSLEPQPHACRSKQQEQRASSAPESISKPSSSAVPVFVARHQPQNQLRGANTILSAQRPPRDAPHQRRLVALARRMPARLHAAALVSELGNKKSRASLLSCWSTAPPPNPSERERREAGASLHELNESIHQWKVINACR